MNTDFLVLLALSLLVAMALYKYVWWKIGCELDQRASYAVDPDARARKIADLTTLISNKPSDTDALLLRSSLYFYENDHAAAITDLEKYLEIKPGDSEAWAELAENRLRLDNARMALMAAEKAIDLDEKYADYRALALRCCLACEDTAKAAEHLQVWQQLDEKRVKDPVKPHRWSRDYQMPQPELSADPAISLYKAALLYCEGEIGQAGRSLEELRDSNPEYYAEVMKADPVLKTLIPEDVLCGS